MWWNNKIDIWDWVKLLVWEGFFKYFIRVFVWLLFGV